MKETLLRGARATFQFDRILCRLFVSWFAFVALLLLENGEGFSVLSYAQTTSWKEIFLPMILLFLFFSLVSVFGGGLHSDSWFLLIFSFVCVYRWILEYDHETNNFLFLLAVITVFAMVLVAFFKLNQRMFALWKPKKWMVNLGVALGTALACAILIVITCLRYKTFSSPNFDFGLFCNMFYNMKETGAPLVTSERDRLLSHFAVHISPIYYLFLPFFYVFPTPETLQIGQAVILMAGVIPVVLLARHFKLSGKVTLLGALLYAFYPVISTGCFYDLHENCFLPFFLLWTFYFFETKKWLPMYLSAACVLMVKEDAAVYLLMFAFFVILSERNFVHGGLLSALSVGYFAFAAHMLTKYGEGMMVNRFDNLIFDEKDGLIGAIKTALVNPGFLLTQLFTTSKGTWEKLIYVLQMLLPLGFLPFCTKKLSRWLLVAPMLVNLLTYYTYQYDIGFQYHFAISAFLIYAMMKNLPELSSPTRRNLMAIAAAACCCIYIVMVVPKFQTYTSRWENNQETYLRMEEFLDTIPQDASVSCSSFLLAHIADRDEVYEAGYHKDKPDVDYVVLDLRYSSSAKVRSAYLRQGYTEHSMLEGLILVLESPEMAAQNAGQ